MNIRSRLKSATALPLAFAALVAVSEGAWAADYVSTPNDTFNIKCTAGVATTTLNVTESFPVLDVNVGVIMAREFREDIRIRLTSPANPGSPSQTVILATGPAPNTSLSNYNILLDDEGPYVINTNAHNAANDDVNAPPYGDTVRPENPLSAFDGVNPQGVWTLDYCDNFNTTFDTDGTVERFELQFAESSDLELNLAASDTNPGPGGAVNIQVALGNAGNVDSTASTVTVALPAGLTYQSHLGPGTYNPATGEWTLGTIAPGDTEFLLIQAGVNGGGTVNAEVSAQTPTDIDSTPGNGQNGEDDSDAVTINVVATNPPSFACPLGIDVSELEWDTPPETGGNFAWNPGDLTNAYSPAGTTKPINMAMTVSGNTNRLIARTTASGTFDTPVTDPQMTGGGAGGVGVLLYVDFENYNEQLTLGFTVGEPDIGVANVQFPIYDVDEGTWTDRIIARGFLGSSTTPITPTYTTSASNTQGQGGVIGTGGSSNTQGLGNMWVSFLQPVDRVEFDYGNVANVAGINANATANPAAQVVSMEDIKFCERPEPKITASKNVETVPPGEPMIPGQQVRYTITVNNAADATEDAQGLTLQDVLADDLRFVSASSSGFTAGAFGSPALPASNTDCAGGACDINFENGVLPDGSTGVVTIIAEVK